ncbi:MAG: sulfatase [Halobacteriaceae archaeon]
MSDPPAENALIVVLDTVRASSTSFGGREITPTLDRVAGEGTRFERAITPAPWTLPAHASFYTGLYPSEHGAVHGHRWLAGEHTTLAERLHDEGFATGVFTPNAFLTESFNMARGFDEVSFTRGEANRLFADGLDPVAFLNEREHDSGLARLREIAAAVGDGPVLKNIANAAYFKYRDLRGDPDGMPPTHRWDEQAVADATAFVEERAAAGERFFAVVNLVQAHAPWAYDPERLRAVGVEPREIAPPERWREVAAVSEKQWEYAAGEIEFDDTDRRILEALYESWIHAVDSLAGDLLDTLDEVGVLEDTLVVMTADHGESLAEDGVLGHELTVSERVAHVPLAVRGPGVPGGSVERTVSLRDLYGTVLSGLDVGEVPGVFDTGRQGEALVEAFGVNPENVDERFREVVGEYGTRRALFTDEGWAERRSEQTFGDSAVLDRLDSTLESLHHAGVGEREESLPP